MFNDSTRKRLGILIPKMASDHDGETAATVRAIQKVLAAEGKDLHDLAKAATTKSTPSENRNTHTRHQAHSGEWQDMAAFCAEHADRLGSREADFARDMVDNLQRYRTPTEKQGAWLRSIYQRLKATQESRGYAG